MKLKLKLMPIMNYRKALINQVFSIKEYKPFKQGVRGSNPRWSTKKRDGQQAVSFAAVLPVENPGHECEIAGCRFSGEAIAIKIKAFPRKARQKAGVRIPAGAPTQNRLKRGGFAMFCTFFRSFFRLRSCRI